jgi:putative ABC transport system permease protein
VDDNNAGPRPLEVVGVVGDVRQMSLDGEQLHEDVLGLVTANMYWVLRGRAGSVTHVEELRQAMRSGDPAAPIADLRSLERSVASAVAPRRFNLLVLAVFAAAALLLSATGIYAMLSYSVSQRTREFEIRSALGARPDDLLLLVVVGQGLIPALAGMALGLAAAFAITRTLASMLFGLTATDPVTFAGVSLGILIVAVASCIGLGLGASRAAMKGAAARTS